MEGTCGKTRPALERRAQDALKLFERNAPRIDAQDSFQGERLLGPAVQLVFAGAQLAQAAGNAGGVLQSLYRREDVDFIKEVQGVVLDPSMPLTSTGERKTTSKMIIDATRYDAKNFSSVCVPAAATLKKVDREWEKYGIRGSKV